MNNLSELPKNIDLNLFLNLPWNCYDNLKVNNINISQDLELMILSTNHGYWIFDIQTYTLLTEVDVKFQNNLGDIFKALTYFSSNLIFFIGNENNEKYKSNEFYICDNKTKEINKILELKLKIIDFYISKEIIFIFISNKVLLFDFRSFKYIHSIENIASNIKQICSCGFDYNNYTYFVKISSEKMNVINCYIYYKDIKKNKIYNKISEIKIQNFTSINSVYLNINRANKFLIVLNHFSNKIHILVCDNNFNFNLKYCLYLGKQFFNISDVLIDKRGKYLIILINKYMFQLYKFSSLEKRVNKIQNIEQKENFEELCFCQKYDDNQIRMSISNTLSNYSKLSRLYSIATGATICNQKILLTKIKDLKVLLFNNIYTKKGFQCVNYNGDVDFIIFGKKNKGRVDKTITWLH
jgi:hypothetical protein